MYLKNYAWESAAWFYSIHSNANNLAANGASVEEITRSINGGYNALEKRKASYQKAKSFLIVIISIHHYTIRNIIH